MRFTDLSSSEKELLRDIAHRSISQGILGDEPFLPDVPSLPKVLQESGASFVTLTLGGRLRGCIGTLEAEFPVAEDVARNAYAAAFRDPRFSPLSGDEWPDCSVEISLLTTPQDIVVVSEAELLKRLKPGIDGVVLSWRGHRATYLPSVWEQLPSPAEFIAQLKRKAGLSADFWADDIQVSLYEVAKV